MRILHVVATGQRRGAEMFASDLVRALARDHDLDQEVALLRGPWPAEVTFEAKVRSMRGSGTRIPGFRMDVATLSNLRAAAARFHPQVLHAHGGEAFKYSVFATAGRGTPIVYRRIGSAAPHATTGLRRRVHTALLRRSDRVVAVAEAIRRETVETFRIDADQVITIPRGVDPDRLRPERSRDIVREELGIPPSAPTLICVGALSPEKDPLAHLDICQELTRSFPDLAYLFAGDGPLRVDLEEAVRARGLEARVRVLGVRTDIGDLLGASDILVLASLVEGMPGCVIEAGMIGVPVVALRVAGVPEVLADGVTGYILEPGDHAGLAERASQLLHDASRRQAMGRAAADRCLATFDIEGIANRYVDVYTQVGRR